MRFLSVPGPRDVLALVDRGGDVVEQIIGTLPRIVPLVEGAQRVVNEAEGVFRRIEETRQAAASVIARIQTTAARVDSVVEGVDAIAGRVDRIAERVDVIAGRVDALAVLAEDVLGRGDAVVNGADTVVGRVDALSRRVNDLLDELEPSLHTLQPTLDRLAYTMGAREVAALAMLLDQIPRLVADYEGEVLPVITTLRSVSPDIHDLLDTSRELNELLVKVPGMGRIKKKVEEEQSETDAG